MAPVAFFHVMMKHAIVRCTEINLFHPRSCPERFFYFSLQLKVSLIDLAALRFTSFFVDCKTNFSLRSQMPLDQKTTHVNPDLSNDGHLCTFTAKFFIQKRPINFFLLFKYFCPRAVLPLRNSDENTEAVVGNQQLI